MKESLGKNSENYNCVFHFILSGIRSFVTIFFSYFLEPGHLTVHSSASKLLI